MKQKKLILGTVLIFLVIFLAIGCAEEQSTKSNVVELSPQVNMENSSPDNNVEKPSPENNVEKQKAEIELFTTYIDNIPSSVYNLYPKLDISLVSYEIKNNGADILEVTVSSEVDGYTDKAVNKKYISPGQTVKISQTPLLKPGVLDTLTEKKMQIYILKSHMLRKTLKKFGTSKQYP